MLRKYLVKVGRDVPEMCLQTDRQTHRHIFIGARNCNSCVQKQNSSAYILQVALLNEIKSKSLFSRHTWKQLVAGTGSVQLLSCTTDVKRRLRRRLLRGGKERLRIVQLNDIDDDVSVQLTDLSENVSRPRCFTAPRISYFATKLIANRECAEFRCKRSVICSISSVIAGLPSVSATAPYSDSRCPTNEIGA